MMKMVKSAILTAAGIFAVAGTAYAADLPVRKAPEKVFVEVCTNYEGFYRIPGTDTCVRIGGYIRMDWGYGGGTTSTPNFVWSRESGLNGSFTRWVMVFDARPMTDVGPARIYANIIAGNVTSNGAGYTGGTQWVAPNTSITVQLAYIQLHGWEFGYNYSTFSYLHTQYLMHVMLGGDDRWITGIRYTASITKELQATIAIEDSGARRQPILALGTSIPPALAGIPGFIGLPTLIAPALVTPNNIPPLGIPGGAGAGWAGKSLFPEIVGRLQYRGAWGDIAFMGALHEVRPAYAAPAATALNLLPGAVFPAGGFPVVLPPLAGGAGVGFITPDTQIGFAVQAGLTIKTPGGMNPKISDTFAIEAAYARGATDYVANCSGPVVSVCSGFLAFSRGSNFPFAKNNFVLLYGDAVFNPATGSVDLVESWNVGARYRHFWTPYVRSTHAFSYTVINFTGPAAINLTQSSTAFGGALGTINSPLVGADFKILDITNEVIWSPYTDLDLGIGVTWIKVDPNGVKEYDAWAGHFRAQWNF
jgi:hypothetical protein